MNDQEQFEYSYSAPTEEERKDTEDVKRQYEPAPKDGRVIGELRALDKKVRRLPLVIGWVMGVVGTLILGIGMTVTLEWNSMVWGTVVGVVGIAVFAAAYPVYKALLKIGKRKYGERITELSNELLNEKKDD